MSFSFRSIFSKRVDIKSDTDPTVQSSTLTITNYSTLVRMYGLKTYLNRIREIVGLPEQHFDLLYLTPIKHLVSRLQHSPASDPNYPALVVQKLHCVLKGMSHRETFIMPAGVEPEDINHKRDVWRYATFFTLMVYDIGPSITGTCIRVKDKDHNHAVWNFFGKIPALGSAIHYENAQAMSHNSSLLFAPLLFPPSSLHWIQQEHEAFNESLSVIQNPTKNTLIGKVVCYAYDLVEHTNSECDVVDRNQKLPTPLINPKDRTITPIPAKEHGKNFLSWLKKNAQSSTSPIEYLTMTHAGDIAFRAPQIFQEFAVSNAIDWKVVKNGFNKLRIHRTCKIGSVTNDLHELEGPDRKKYLWLVIPSDVFELTNTNEDLTPNKIPFIDWLIKSINSNNLPNTKTEPLYIPLGEALYLVDPSIFEHYSMLYSEKLDDVRGKFLRLGIHEKSGSSDVIELPYGDSIIQVIKTSTDKLLKNLSSSDDVLERRLAGCE